jgi:hypothetical protein
MAMTSSKDIYIPAQLLLKQHGDKAEDVADKRMQELMAKDDAKGAAVWLSISSAIHDLRCMQSLEKLH